MQALILSVLLSLATPGITAHLNHHRHAHVHERDVAVVATVVDVLTVWETLYVYPDGQPASTAFSSAPTTNLEAILLQVSTNSSTSSSTSSSKSTTTSTTSSVVSVEPVQEAQVLPTSSSTTTQAPVVTQAPAPVATDLVTGLDTVTEGGTLYRVIYVTNAYGSDISTAHDDTTGTPISAGAKLNPTGVLPAGAMASFEVPLHWVGNVAIADAKYGITTSSTLIEGNFNEWQNSGEYTLDYDISIVNGHTVPVSCSCGESSAVVGCNLDLFGLSTCPESNLFQGACANPYRADVAATSAAPFFQPCQGASWAFVNDGRADYQCFKGAVVCCIGTICPANPKQGKGV